MSTKEQIKQALHIENKDNEDPKSRLIICVKRKINGIDLDNGHFGLICAHSTGIAFNAWDGNQQNNSWFTNYPNITFNDNFTSKDFNNWRYNSFRKLVLEVSSDKEFENIKEKLIRDEIPFRICGEIAFGDAEVAIVVFPITQEQTPKYLKFMRVWK